LIQWSGHLFGTETLAAFNFGPSLINWIKLCYQDIDSCVLNNGWTCDFFKPQRGVRQGCPLSPYVFILCVEILAEKIRKQNDIKGIYVRDTEIKISQYADDTTIILDDSNKSFTSTLLELDLFSKISGLKLNNKKTEVLWIGSRVGNQDKICPERNLKWVNDKVKALGVWISSDPEAALNINYSEKITKIRNSLNCWELRRLSLLGKIVVLKSLIVSQLVYILSPLPTLYRAIEEINNMFYQFVWSDKGDKIKRKVMINDYENGGLRMIDVEESFNKALKSTWVKKYQDQGNQGKWKLFFDHELQNYGGIEVFRGNLNKKDLSSHFYVADTFIKEILKIWTEVNYDDSAVRSTDHLLSSNLWNNSLIRVENKPIYYRSWSAKGIQKVRHLTKDSSTNFLSFSEFKETFDIKTNFLTFYGLISSIKALRNLKKEEIPQTEDQDNFVDNFVKAKKNK